MAGTFVEIGSCDFDNYDILLLDGWTGYFVEPVPEYLNSLCGKITRLGQERNKTLKAFFTCGAISNFSGTNSIRYIPPDNLMPWWSKGLGHVTGFKNNGIEMRESFSANSKTITSVFYTLDDYIKMMSISEIDIMKVDVEGHELHVFENYSWKIKPRHIKIEHTFVGHEPLVKMLVSQGYTDVYFDSEDVYGTFKG